MSHAASRDVQSTSSVLEESENKSGLSKLYDGSQMDLIEEIGGGGMSRIFLYYLNKDGCRSEVAIKTLVPNCVTPRELERLRSEADILTRVNHENIIRIYGVAKVEFGFALILEYFPRGSYSQVFDTLWETTDKALLMEDVAPLKLRMIGEVANGMEYLHFPRKFPAFDKEKTILHLDLKGDNVLLDEHLHVKICDFGLGMMSTLTKLRTKTTVIKGVCGTPGYIAPERLKKVKSQPSTKWDVYAFGILQYEILTDLAPYPEFDVRDFELLEHNVAVKNYRPNVSNIPSFFPADLINLIEECWMPEPCSRPPFDEICDRMFALRAQIDDFERKASDSARTVMNILPNVKRSCSSLAILSTLPDFNSYASGPTGEGNDGTFDSTLSHQNQNPSGSASTEVKVAAITSSATATEQTGLLQAWSQQQRDILHYTTDDKAPLCDDPATGNCTDPPPNYGTNRQSGVGKLNSTWILLCLSVIATIFAAAAIGVAVLITRNSGNVTGCSRIPKEDHLIMNCTKGKYPTCLFSCEDSRIMQGKSIISCLRNGSWSAPAPFCLCPKCHVGDNCEYSNDWNDVADSLADIQYTSPVTLNYGGKRFTCNASEYTASFKWIAQCVDRVRYGTTEICVDDNSAFVAATAAAAKLINVLAKQGSYPVPCHSRDMPHKCEKLRQYI